MFIKLTDGWLAGLGRASNLILYMGFTPSLRRSGWSYVSILSRASHVDEQSRPFPLERGQGRD